MQILALRANKPYQQEPQGDVRHHRFIKPYLYSFLAAIFVSESLCITLYLTGWDFGLFFFDLRSLNPLTIVLQVMLILLIFGILWVSFIYIEAMLITHFLNKNKQSLRLKQKELGLLHPDIQSVRKPLVVLYWIFLILVALTLLAYGIVKHIVFAPSTSIAFAALFTLMRFWHTLHEQWSRRHMVGTSIADLSKYS